MNPESNEFEQLSQENEQAFIDRFYKDRAKSEVPIFQLYERITIKGYIFKVVQMRDDRMVLKPVSKADTPT